MKLEIRFCSQVTLLSALRLFFSQQSKSLESVTIRIDFVSVNSIEHYKSSGKQESNDCPHCDSCFLLSCIPSWIIQKLNFIPLPGYVQDFLGDLNFSVFSTILDCTDLNGTIISVSPFLPASFDLSMHRHLNYTYFIDSWLVNILFSLLPGAGTIKKKYK